MDSDFIYFVKKKIVSHITSTLVKPEYWQNYIIYNLAKNNKIKFSDADRWHKQDVILDKGNAQTKFQ